MPKTIKTIDDLCVDDFNANRHTQRGIGMTQQSIQQLGYGDSLTVDKNGKIISGNSRAEILADVKMLDAIVVQSDGTRPIVHQRIDLDLDTDKRARLLSIALNRTHEVSLDWDPSVLSELIDKDFDLSPFFFEDELAALLASVNEQEPEGLLPDADPDPIPTNVETRCKPGDLWQLGRHRVLCGDATSATDYEALMGDETPAMVWADPPYGIAIAKSGHVAGGTPFGGKNKGKAIAVIAYAPIIGDETTDTAADSFNFAFSALPEAVHFWWGGNYYADRLPPSSCWLVWDKDNGTNNFADAELAWTNQKTSVRIYKHTWSGLVRASERGEKRVHPTQKPVALAEWAFEKYGADGDLIFDPFLGSGMSIIAAEKTKRKVYGMELSPEYCDVIIKRWETCTGKQAELINGTTNEV